MLIDWFTVIAQMINFLVLVALLKYFLFNPIMGAMSERRERIDSSIAEARRREEQAGRELESYRAKNLELDRKREEILHEAEEEARRRGEEHLRQARAQASAEQARLGEALRLRKSDLAEKLMLMSLHDAAGMASRTLEELSGSPIEEALVAVFLQKLAQTDRSLREQLASAARKGGGVLAVSSSFEMGEALKQKLSSAVEENLPGPLSIRFEQAPGMALGIEMSANGYKLRWGVEQYLGDVQEQVSRVIAEAFGAGGETGHA